MTREEKYLKRGGRFKVNQRFRLEFLKKQYFKKLRYYGSEKRMQNVEKRKFWARWKADNLYLKPMLGTILSPYAKSKMIKSYENVIIIPKHKQDSK